MPIEQLEEKVWAWAEERDLYNQSTKKSRFNKIFEEINEFGEAIFIKHDIDEIILEAGDIIVTLINNLKPMGITLEECLSAAYEKIKDRKGKMVGGTFVKEDGNV